MAKFGNLKAVIWDMDGVIIDSHRCHFYSWEKICEKYGWKYSEDIFFRTFGMTNDKVILNITDGEIDTSAIPKITAEKDEIFCKVVAEQAKFINGVQFWLNEFKTNGIKQALASSGSWQNINTIMDALKIRSFFDALISGEDSVSKPDPAVFLLAAKEVRVAPVNCLVIEDAIAGVQAAVAAEMKCLALTTSNPASRLPPADLVLPDPSYLTEEMLRDLFKG